MNKLLTTLFVFLFFVAAKSQETNLSSFNAVTLTYKFHPKFFLYGEGQLRGIEEFDYPDYYEIKGGLGYNLASNHKPFVGIGRYVTYKDKLLDREEFRIWLQDVYDLKAGRVKFENRIRGERSWFNVADGSKDDRTRFRYRLNVSVPLNGTSVKPGVLFVNAYDEVFFVTTSAPLFARNRVFGGIGYQIDETFGVASGYLWQREFSKSGAKNINFIYLALNINIDDTDDERGFNFPGAD